MSDSSPATIRRATQADLPRITHLFDEYRVHYGQTTNPQAASDFLSDRLEKQDSVIFVAERGGAIDGFMQLYPSFSSVAMGKIWILNDIFVAYAARHSGIASALLETAADHARQTGATRLELSTARDNNAARALYEKAGWKLDEIFVHYYLATNPAT